MKKYLSMVLSISLSLSSSVFVLGNPLDISIPVKNVDIDKNNSFTYGNITYTITQNSSQTLKGYVTISNGKDFKDKNLNIPNNVTYQGKTYIIDSISPYAFYQNNNIEKVTISNTIKNIGNGAFTDCQNLKEINVTPGANKYASVNGVLFNVTKDTLITYPAGKLDKQYNLPFNVTKIEQGAFYNNKNLERFIANSDLREIGSYAFANSQKLIEVSGIINLKTLGDYAFAQSSIQTIYLGTNLENMGKATFYNSNIKNIEIPYRVKSLPEYSFYGCKNLNNVAFKNGLVNIESFAFKNSNIESFYAPNSLISIDYQAFANCTNLKNVSFNLNLQTIKDEAFLNCSSIPNITINRDLKNIGKNVFYGCDNINKVSVDNSIHFELLDNVLYKNGKTELTYVPPKREISYLNIPKETTSIKDDALNMSNSIDNINVDEKNENFSSQDGVLYDKDKKSLIKFPTKKSTTNFNIPYSVEEIKPFAFANANKFYGVISIGEKVNKIGNNAFDNMPNLDGFTVDIMNDKYSAYNGILFNNDQTLLIKYPSRKKLDTFTIPDKTKTIGERAFEQANISSLTLGVNVESIEKQAFLNAPINKITIKEGLTTIKDEAFKGTNIESIIFPSTLLNIGDHALSYCNNLKNVQFNALQTNSFGYNMFIGSNKLGKIIVPINSYNNYKSYLSDSDVSNWQNILQEYKPPIEEKNNNEIKEV